jgi:hypothetical protein
MVPLDFEKTAKVLMDLLTLILTIYLGTGAFLYAIAIPSYVLYNPDTDKIKAKLKRNRWSWLGLWVGIAIGIAFWPLILYWQSRKR